MYTDFGSKHGNFMGKDPSYFPDVKRLAVMEYKYSTNFNGIHMIGFSDSQAKNNKAIDEYKTAVRPWTQKRVDEHKQLTNYCLQNFIKNKIKPEDVKLRLMWWATEEKGDFTVGLIDPKAPPTIFHTKRTMGDILQYGVYINETIIKMDKYIKEHE